AEMSGGLWHGICMYRAENCAGNFRQSRKIWIFRKMCLPCQRKASGNSDVSQGPNNDYRRQL
ncbi:MAG: hypothetical protein IJV64_00245, partial [Oscillospiraceae bacterium]|nr:hypothetical protein [Oscillospiraceae bacterium]